MRVIILEDETKAALKLEGMLKQIDPTVQIAGTFESVADAAAWLQNNPAPELGFFDIHLADDLSFKVFELAEVRFPVIFITAYDDYMLKAFEHNSIHYLLKPISSEKLFQALQKKHELENYYLLKELQWMVGNESKNKYKNRLVVLKGMSFTPVEVNDIAYIFTEHKINFLRDNSGNTYSIHQSLKSLETAVDPSLFFRANRQFLVHIQAISSFRSIDQSKIQLTLNPKFEDKVIIGKENAVEFRKWIKG